MSVAPERPAPAPVPTPPPTGDAVDARVERPRPSRVRSIVRTARPKQWLKNLLVFAAPGAAGVLTQTDQLARTLVAFVAFCFAASGTYFLNDALDAEADRQHPTKQFRPIAAGDLSPNTARVIGITLVVLGIGIAAPVNGGKLAGVVAAYVALTISYSLWLKHEPVIDLGAVAAGFVLRAVAGGVATNVTLSNWFLIVAGAGSLFVVAGKRSAELTELGDASGSHRATLDEYTDGFLRYVRAVSSGVAITAYCLWAFENSNQHGNTTWYQYSIVPFVLGVLRYAHMIEQGHGGAPEDVILADRVILLLGVLWAVTFALGVHA
jgi:decaprenyl-phosphate phosphoribosyltransferase